MTKNNLQKLELTWIGKGEEPKLEPRILIENPEYSYGDPESENILIHGDNLLALKALEQDFAGKVKCIYIDPPFNTGSRIDADGNEVGYDDGIEHSTWLSMMFQRITILHRLLEPTGAIFIHLDDNEADYCKVILDQIFGRNNFMNKITIDARSPSAFSTVNPGMFVASEYILYYAKNRSKLVENPIRIARAPDYAYNKFILNYNENYNKWKFISVSNAFAEMISLRSNNPENIIKQYNKFIIDNSYRICRYTAISDSGAGQKIIELKNKSLENREQIFKLERSGLDDVYVMNGQQISFYSKNISVIDNEEQATMPLTDIWTDIAWEGIAKEGNVTFKKGKKPEKLIRRCLSLITNEGDLVLDSFLGSGTTTAVAQKMNRRWIGIELGDHAVTHCYPRMKAVVDGEQGGISKAVNWKGGGGFKFYELAPSLLNKDKFDNWIISPQYNPAMLTAAMAKQEGFVFQPHESIYWKQGRSSEQDFIFTTTQFLTVEVLDNIHDEMQPDESLLICCKAFQKECKKKYPNITIKKIPQMLLGRCEFGKDDYSLNIVNLPSEEPDEDWDDFDGTDISSQEMKTQEENNQQLDLF
ncbi:site-specific DNA-methyltransferase [Paludibacter sp. 221]|uniref:site-specific DNA-methyltransferase n=1 Tax=Paludibacter sp. 221 TaxID=2302939 RepID=UPI0013D54596|nr:site-specific DNA-methyltransferase [Paludibacter sp. 221]NDV46878.1 site-specific DNA-methyltransferase [Paludibacter sp. 221]